MSAHYIENTSSGNQYYFNANNTTTSQAQRTGYSNYPTSMSGSYSPNQQIRIDNSYQIPQQYQSVAGFNRNATQQGYQSPKSPAPQVRASVRVIGSQDQYNLPSSSQLPTQVSPQQHHFQFDSRQQAGHATGPAVVYQTPGAAQYTHHNVDLWTESPSQGQDYYAQAQRVSVRPVSTGSPQQSHSISPQRHQDHLQQYYSQLTPEQHQQLLRQQQLQRQQEQKSYYEQQPQRVTPQQVSPSSTYHQEQHRSTASFGGGQQNQQVSPNQQGRSRSEIERQRQDEQAYYAAQRQMAAQRVQQPPQQQQEEQSSHPVGIRNLMSKFAGPTPAQQYRPRSTSSRQYSSSSYTTNAGPNQTTTRTLTSQSITYSALPKPQEPPVNSVEYYQMQMQQQGGNPFTNIQQAAAPAHIQHTPTGLGGLRDRFKTGSLSDDFNRPQVVNRQQPPPQQRQQQQQQPPPSPAGSSLLSLRNQYMNRTKEPSQDELPSQPVQNISRTIIGEDIPKQKPAPQPSQQQQQPAPVLQAPEQAQPQNENTNQQAPSSEVASPPTTDTTTADEGVSSF